MTTTEAKRVYLQNENDEILLPYSSQAIEDGDGNIIADTYLLKDISNITTSGKSLVAGFPFPSGSHIDLSLGPTGSIYSAPADGWFFLSKNITANGQFATLEVLNDNDSIVLQVANSVTTVYWSGFIPCKKGSNVRVQYNLGGSTISFRFIYAVGNAPQSTESED